MNSKPFTEVADLRSILATVPEDVATHLVSDMSKILSEKWLSAAAGEDWLRARFDTNPDFSKEEALEWVARAKAVSTFVSGISLEILTHDPLFGELPEPIAAAVFGAPPATADAFALLVSQAEDTLKSTTQQVREALGISEGVAHLLLAAIALDRPMAVRSLVQASPAAAGEMVPLALLGPGMQDQATPGRKRGEYEMLISPIFAAVQLSRERCMDELFAVLPPNPSMLGLKIDGVTAKYSVARMHEIFSTTATPQALTHALKQIASHPDLVSEARNRMASNAVAIMRDYGRPFLRAFVQSFAAAGIYDADPVPAITEAIKFGHGSSLHHLFKAVEWDDLAERFKGESNPFRLAANESRNAGDYGMEDAIMRVIDEASSRDRLDDVLVKHVMRDNDSGHLVVEPMASIARAGFKKVLVKMVNLGVDFHAADPTERAQSPLEYARAHLPTMASVIEACEARNAAFNVIGESLSKKAITPRQ